MSARYETSHHLQDRSIDGVIRVGLLPPPVVQARREVAEAKADIQAPLDNGSWWGRFAIGPRVRPASFRLTGDDGRAPSSSLKRFFLGMLFYDYQGDATIDA